MSIIVHVLKETLQISLVITVLMIIVDGLNVLFKGKLEKYVGGRGARQYVIASFFGTTPGCAGAFVNVTLYVHGLISFGALTGGMIATSGDEAFLMLAMFPGKALLLFGLLFISGIIFGVMTDRIVHRFNIKTCTNCNLQTTHDDKTGIRHFFTVHIWKHILKKHIWKVALWTFFALLAVEYGTSLWNLEQITPHYIILLFFLAALIGVIPESGPHIIFITLFAKGLIPFSLLFTSAFIQDGHGLLPMLSYSVKDTMRIKIFNIVFGLGLGLLFYVGGF